MTVNTEIRIDLPGLQNGAEAIQDFVDFSSIKNVIYEAKSLLDRMTEKSKQVFHDIETYVTTIPLKPLIDRINRLGTSGEKIFNVMECMLFIGPAMGSLRAGVGYLQVLAGAAIAAIGEVGAAVCKIRKSDDEEMQARWKTISVLGAEQIVHGCLNIIRGYTAASIGQYTLGLGNIILLAPNVSKEESFSPYFNYGTLTDRYLETKK